ncbi:S66 peptidase family protein [Anaeromyxobacter terrae]|uniref:S66 peptidase family protein n=1 Tax=Anaeromyxobacter terrae TaxID=2925406 RepID=UPI001F59633B|nr:LD-carboxypeptidase [Anaeromyxobacter sp. SG22]
MAVIAPGGMPDPLRLERGLAAVRGFGYAVVEGPKLRRRARYTAGTAADRGADLVWALTAPGVDAVWFARGGFGTAHLLAALPPELPPRVVIGYSDATALFCALAGRDGLHLLHGPVLQELGDHTAFESLARLRQVLASGEAPPLSCAGPARPVRGRLIGGNLAVLASLCGTPWQLDARGAIVVLEEVAEAPYRLDRLVTQLVQSGAIDGAAAVTLGELVRCAPPGEAPGAAEDVIADLLAPLGIPVVRGLPVGHGPRNDAFWWGDEAVLEDGALAF